MPPPNLIPNPDFEVNATGWLNAGNATSVTRDTAQFHGGVASLKVITTGDGSAAITPALTLSGSTKYSYSAWFYSVAGMNAWVELSDNIDQGLTSSNIAVGAATWTLVSFTGVTDAHTSRTFRAGCRGAQTYWVDDAMLSPPSGHGDTEFAALGPKNTEYSETGHADAG